LEAKPVLSERKDIPFLQEPPREIIIVRGRQGLSLVKILLVQICCPEKLGAVWAKNP
jgi:hypothetical protein